MAEPVLTAVVPVAGRGTRLRPWSYAAPKALLPLVDAGGHVRPVVHHILARRRQRGELQLADAQGLLLERQPERYFLREILGRAWDVGTPAGYAGTLPRLRQRGVAQP
jgi:UTP-glucose-1-phosphate uridylyltransferase